MLVVRALVTLFAACAFFATAQACDVADVDLRPAGDQAYDPNAVTPLFLQFELDINASSVEDPCVPDSIEIVSAANGSVRNFRLGNAVLPGQLPPARAGLPTTNSQRIVLDRAFLDAIGPSGTVLIDFAIIAPGMYLPAGTYTNLLSVRAAGRAATEIEAAVTVLPAFRLFGEAASGRGSLDFGTLVDNASVSSDFIYQSNARVTVSAYSENGGKLVHEDGISLGSIPYTTYINGRLIASDGNQLVELTSSGTGQKRIGNVQVRVGVVGNPNAGTYKDILTLSFSAS